MIGSSIHDGLNKRVIHTPCAFLEASCVKGLVHHHFAQPQIQTPTPQNLFYLTTLHEIEQCSPSMSLLVCFFPASWRTASFPATERGKPPRDKRPRFAERCLFYLAIPPSCQFYIPYSGIRIFLSSCENAKWTVKCCWEKWDTRMKDVLKYPLEEDF